MGKGKTDVAKEVGTVEKKGIPLIVSESGKFTSYNYSSEKELERMAVEHSMEIFGKNVFYFDTKKKLVSKKGIGGIPDGFLIDPENDKFYIIEVELSTHDIVRHISNQLIRFKVAMENNDTRKRIAKDLYEQIAKEHPENGTSLERIQQIINKQFGILILIDSISEQLTEIVGVLSQDGTEVLAIPFETYINSRNDHIHKFTTFTKDALERESRKWAFKWTTVPVEKHLDRSSDYMKETFSRLSTEICSLPNVKEKSRKGWVTYQTSPLKNFCTIKILPNCLEINLKSDRNFLDERGIAKSIKRTQAWTFDKVFIINSASDLEYAIYLIKQAYECMCKR